jgi:hypothetical protein
VGFGDKKAGILKLIRFEERVITEIYKRYELFNFSLTDNGNNGWGFRFHPE